MKPDCAYKYIEEDRAVVSGKKGVGAQCSNPAAEGCDKYCRVHAKILVKRGELILAPGVDLGGSGGGSKKKRQEETAQGRENALKKDIAANLYLSKLAGLVNNGGFNAEAAIESVKMLNPLPLQDRGVEKYLFGLWLLAPAHLRRPKDLVGFSDLTGIPYSTLEVWRTGKALISVFRDHRANFMMQQGRMVDISLLAKCMSGSESAMKLYYDKFPIEGRELKEDPGPKGSPKNAFDISKMALEASKKAFNRKRGEGSDIPKIMNKQVEQIKDAVEKDLGEAVLNQIKGKVIGG